MKSQIRRQAELLKELEPEALYNTFHEIQHRCLRPQMEIQFQKIMNQPLGNQVLEVGGPRSPGVPSTFSKNILHQISKSKCKILFLNGCLRYAEDSMAILESANKAEFQMILIHDVSMNGSFVYQSFPENKYFKTKNEEVKNKSNSVDQQNLFEAVKGWVCSSQWEISCDDQLIFSYDVESKKSDLVLMALGLDLIEFHYSAKLSQFDEILFDLEKWCLQPGSWAKLSDCSRWMMLSRK